jgi:hypothetical protein
VGDSGLVQTNEKNHSDCQALHSLRIGLTLSVMREASGGSFLDPDASSTVSSVLSLRLFLDFGSSVALPSSIFCGLTLNLGQCQTSGSVSTSTIRKTRCMIYCFTLVAVGDITWCFANKKSTKCCLVLCGEKALLIDDADEREDAPLIDDADEWEEALLMEGK